VAEEKKVFSKWGRKSFLQGKGSITILTEGEGGRTLSLNQRGPSYWDANSSRTRWRGDFLFREKGFWESYWGGGNLWASFFRGFSEGLEKRGIFRTKEGNPEVKGGRKPPSPKVGGFREKIIG